VPGSKPGHALGALTPSKFSIFDIEMASFPNSLRNSVVQPTATPAILGHKYASNHELPSEVPPLHFDTD
jgi:hypothetical protein